jgi:hypothetical protein
VAKRAGLLERLHELCKVAALQTLNQQVQVVRHEAVRKQTESGIPRRILQHLAAAVDLSSIDEYPLSLPRGHSDGERGRATVEMAFKAVSFPPPGLPPGVVLQGCSASGDLKVAATHLLGLTRLPY